jgi:hypothetical protein
LDDLGFTITLVSFSDSLPARETRRRCTVVASFGYGIQRGEIGNGQGCLSSRLW